MDDDLFNLNDYDEETREIIITPEPIEKKKDDVRNLYQITAYEDKKNEELDLKEKINLELDKLDQLGTLKKEEEKVSSLVTDSNQALEDSFESKIKINTNQNLITAEAREKCLHAIDDKIDIKEYNLIVDPALKFPFELDIFQKRSVIRLERHQNVLVCAHTSSGKTVVAEYAIALGKKLGKRVFYTSPIKALSNQKYREFKKKFDDVGILTGDVSITPDAQCLIMTTEILQSSLYKNSDMLNLVEWVVFDEVHYINDNERGHVWEEILILLPPQIGIVMLSATIPNYIDFAKWVGRIKNTTIYIQNTTHRVVPLEHKIFISSKEIFLAKDKTDKVDDKQIMNAMNQLDNLNDKLFKSKNNPKTKKEKQENETKILNRIRDFNRGVEKREKENFNKSASNNAKSGGYNNGGNGGMNKITMTHLKLEEIVSYLLKNDLTPCVIFVFSIKKIDDYARLLASKEPRVDKVTSHKITKFFDKCMSKLSNVDREINQVQIMRRILAQGIGVHHAGLIPILKETIEILYSKGLLKILCATTSFSIGLNMPTRTVVFTEITKFNEDKKEILSSSEYLQMCGRAGRRGIDQTGHIFLLMGDKQYPPKGTDIGDMMKGGGTQVESKFRLSYRTLISFLSRNVKDIFEFFKESFLENNKILIMPKIIQSITDIKQELFSLPPINCIFQPDKDDYIRKYVNDLKAIKTIRPKLFAIADIRNKLQPGRLIQFNSKRFKKDIHALVLFYYNEYEQYRCILVENNPKLVVEYEESKKNTIEDPSIAKNIGILNKKFYEYFEIGLDDIVEIMDFTIKIDTNSFDWDGDNYCYIKKKDLEKVLNDIISAVFDKQPKPFDYSKLTRNDITAFDLINNKTSTQKSIKESKCHDCYLREEHKALFEKKIELENKYKEFDKTLSEENLKYHKEFLTRMDILKRLGYIDEDNLILLKAKAAREIASSDCVLISELLLTNILENLDVAESVAFVSGFVFNKNEVEIEDPDISPNFSKAVKEFENIYKKLIELEALSEFEESKYNRRVTFSVSKAIYLWMKGNSFREIIHESDLEEGKLYTLLMRLYLFLNEIKSFSDIIENSNLSKKFEDAKGFIMRDILSCKSLYLQEDIDIDAEI